MDAGVWLLRHTISDGCQPIRAFWWLAAHWLPGAVIFAQAEALGALIPNDPKTQIDRAWKDCQANPDQPTQQRCFMDRAQRTGYPACNAPVYPAATLTPVIGQEMQACRLPDDRHPPLAPPSGFGSGSISSRAGA